MNYPIIDLIRGKGLFNAIRIDTTKTNFTGWDVCLALKENGLLAKQTHNNVIRFAPPLIISQEQLEECCDIIEKTLSSLS